MNKRHGIGMIVRFLLPELNCYIRAVVQISVQSQEAGFCTLKTTVRGPNMARRIFNCLVV